MMKSWKKMILIGVVMAALTGCGETDDQKGAKSSNSVENVINSQIEDEGKDASSGEKQDTSGNRQADESQNADSGNEVDYDLTQMSSDMVYATVYQMLAEPEQYEGKTFRMEGTFTSSYYEPTGKNYYYCIIQDATACCAQGMEFVWEDDSHVYPDEYPQEDASIIIEGTYETYTEEGDSNLYCHLTDASMKVQ